MGEADIVYKVIIAGGRDFDNLVMMTSRCNGILKQKEDQGIDIQVVSGGQRTWLEEEKRFIGADYFGEIYAGLKSITTWRKEKAVEHLRIFPADWDTLGKRAGPVRNRQMADYADALIAFWDGKSRGTANMIDEMKARNKPFRIINY